MNPGQKQFYEYILERAQAGKEEQVREVMEDNFRKQDEGSFGAQDAAASIPRILELLRPEKIEEVKAVMQQFAGNMQK